MVERRFPLVRDIIADGHSQAAELFTLLVGEDIAAVDERPPRRISLPDQSIALSGRRVEDVALDMLLPGQVFGGLKGEVVGIEREAEARLVGQPAPARDGRAHAEKEHRQRHQPATCRPEGRQQAQPSLGSESIVVPLLAVDRGHRGEYDRIFLPVAHQDCPEHRDHGKGQESAPGKPACVQEERTQANCHHEHIKSSEPVPVVRELLLDLLAEVRDLTESESLCPGPKRRQQGCDRGRENAIGRGVGKANRNAKYQHQKPGGRADWPDLGQGLLFIRPVIRERARGTSYQGDGGLSIENSANRRRRQDQQPHEERVVQVHPCEEEWNQPVQGPAAAFVVGTVQQQHLNRQQEHSPC